MSCNVYKEHVCYNYISTYGEMNRVHSQEVDLILTKIYENGDKIYMPCKILNSVIFKIANPLFYNALLGKPHNTDTF